MNRRELVEAVRTQVSLLREAGPVAGWVVEKIVKIAEEYKVSSDGVFVPRQQIENLCSGIRADLKRGSQDGTE